MNGTQNSHEIYPDAKLAEQRGFIDAIDQEIVHLLNRRAEAAYEIGKIKLAHDLPIYAGSREDDVLSKVCAAHERISGIVPKEDLVVLFQSVMKTSRSVQQRLHDDALR